MNLKGTAMSILLRLRTLIRPDSGHNDSLRAGVFDDVTPLAVLMR